MKRHDVNHPLHLARVDGVKLRHLVFALGEKRERLSPLLFGQVKLVELLQPDECLVVHRVPLSVPIVCCNPLF